MTRKHGQNEPLLEAWSILMLHRRRFIFTGFVAVLVVLLASMLLPKKYSAAAMFERRTDVVMNEIVNRASNKAYVDQRASLYKELAGLTAVGAVIEQLSADPGLMADLGVTTNDLPALRELLLRKLGINFEISTTELEQVRVSLVSERPAFGQWAVNALIENYINQARKKIEQRVRQSADFFHREVARSRLSIEQLENRKLTFEIQNADLLPNSPNNLQTTLVELKSEQTELNNKHEGLTVQIQALEQALGQTPQQTPTTVRQRNPVLDQIEKDLTLARSQLQQNITTLHMTDRHPDMVALRQRIADLETQAADTEQEIVTQRSLTSNPHRDELEMTLTQSRADLLATEKRVASIRGQIAAAEKQTEQMFPVRAEYIKLERQITEQQRQLSFWEDNLRRLDMLLAAESDDRGVRLSFISPCASIGLPVSPQLSQVIIAALTLGLFAGASSVYWAHRTDETFRRSTQLAEALELPVLGSVSELISDRELRIRRLRQLVVYPLNLTAMAAALGLVTAAVYFNLERPELLKKLAGVPASVLTDPHDAPAAVANVDLETDPVSDAGGQE
ncbi:MAG: hypothetical protein IT442_07685 [Phycisphaeraceae bacterium]|nr:hypothetical protein [Phycisphaeraceae bacterium]